MFTLADGTAAAFMGDPTGRLIEIAAALTDAHVAPTDSRDEALRVLGDLVAQVPDFATLEALFEPFAFLVAEVRTVAELAETVVGVRTRGVHRGRARSARIATAPFRSDSSAIGARGPAPRFAQHTRAVLHERLDLDDAELDRLERDGVIITTGPARRTSL